ncbi:hypothetical protein [Rothia sp. ZJ1223]|uniref:restriction system modified-DNA reader domain-containing protein n=1 Tax=Rothia sp. ZJ1223 TaxID=2811098 RepID=UPI001959179A|nr:hypothetical protein [Rothia sp. ZJ1223]MBM7050677.1 hypothetical protein [Rothia sp. ZJ1223]
MSASSDVSVKDLIRANLLVVGQELSPKYSQKVAAVHADGTLAFEGHHYETPTAAAKVAGNLQSVNGWIFWHLENSRETLADLREKYRKNFGSQTLAVDSSEDGDTSSAESEDVESSGVISAFGMFWRRADVNWELKQNVKLLGVHPTDKTQQHIDMAGQTGVYLLHDGSRTIYVGRVSAERLGFRLYEHTIDRVAGRWDRFSWFGLRPVTLDGSLGVAQQDFPAELVISTMEAVLIEGLEPPQNRRQGDGLKGQEYLQAPDQEVQRKRFLQGAIVTGLMSNTSSTS